MLFAVRTPRLHDHPETGDVGITSEAAGPGQSRSAGGFCPLALAGQTYGYA